MGLIDRHVTYFRLLFRRKSACMSSVAARTAFSGNLQRLPKNV